MASPSVFVLGGRGPVSFRGCEGGNVLSQLWSLVVVASPSSVFVLGGGGQSASGAVKGKGGQSALELSCSAGNGGESASGGCEGGMM